MGKISSYSKAQYLVLIFGDGGVGYMYGYKKKALITTTNGTSHRPSSGPSHLFALFLGRGLCSSEGLMVEYRDPRGRTISVISGSGGDCIFAAHCGHRIKSKSLPVRSTEREAQADLDAYARDHRWAIVKENGDFDKTWWMRSR